MTAVGRQLPWGVYETVGRRCRLAQRIPSLDGRSDAAVEFEEQMSDAAKLKAQGDKEWDGERTEAAKSCLLGVRFVVMGARRE